MASTTKLYRHAPYPTISPTAQANSQTGRTVLITGSSRGIGYSIAQAYIQANASQVILTGTRQETVDRAAKSLAESSTGTIIKSYLCDLNDKASIDKLWQRLQSDQISVDVLVLNAADSASGPANPVGPFLSKLRAAFEFNLFSNIFMVARLLESSTSETEKKPKAIVNISSFMAHSNPAPYQAAYSTSKGAFAHTLQLLAGEISPGECQIVNVHPGAILTEATKSAPQEVLDSVIWDNAQLPGAFAVWAATEQAAFLHGRFVWANWDVDELLARKGEFEDPGFLKLGLQGSEFVDIRTIFDSIRKVDARSGV